MRVVPTFSYKDIWKIAFPVILGSVAQNIINITDTAFLGHYSETDLAAAAIAGVFYFAFFMVGYGVAIGAQIIMARRYGEGRFEETGRYFDHAFYLLSALALLLFIVLKFFAPLLLKHVISSTEIYVKVTEFLEFRSFGLFFAFFNISLGAFYVGTANTKIITWGNVIMAVVNLVLAYGLIFGNLGFPRLGIRGAALSNTIAEASATLFFIIWTVKKVPLKKYALLKFGMPELTYLKKLISISAPLMLEFIISFSAWLVFFLMVEKMGKHELAVSNIVRSVYIILMLPIWGFGAAVSSLVSNLLGQKKPDEVMPVIYKAIKLCFLFIALPAIVTIMIPALVISIYTSDASLMQQAVAPVYVITSILFPISAAFIFFHGVSGTGNTRTALLIETSVIVLYLIYVYFLSIVFRTSLTVVWTSEFIYAAFLALFSFIYLKTGKWAEKKI